MSKKIKPLECQPSLEDFLQKTENGSIVLDWVDSEFLYNTDEFCLDMKDGLMTAYVCIEKPRDQTKFK